jgi:hypothetical protein
MCGPEYAKSRLTCGVIGALRSILAYDGCPGRGFPLRLIMQLIQRMAIVATMLMFISTAMTIVGESVGSASTQVVSVDPSPADQPGGTGFDGCEDPSDGDEFIGCQAEGPSGVDRGAPGRVGMTVAPQDGLSILLPPPNGA